jgi:NTP pyrophosphatase (non-canonical NTP hydrolase)
MEDTDIVEKSRIVFSSQQASVMSTTQRELSKWQDGNFSKTTLEQLGLGAAEEVGELCHAILKHSQGIRGFDNEVKFTKAVGDAIADTMIYLSQIATDLGMDVATLYVETANQVMHRNWKNNPKNGTNV